VRARGTRRRLAALRNSFVRHAAGADHGDIAVGALSVAVAQERFAHVVHVGMRDLAAEEIDTERRHARILGDACSTVQI
jgi:hypothetical protein